jgi:hypothetical protein
MKMSIVCIFEQRSLFIGTVIPARSSSEKPRKRDRRSYFGHAQGDGSYRASHKEVDTDHNDALVLTCGDGRYRDKRSIGRIGNGGDILHSLIL